MELSKIEDEIEYFELLPVSFTTELQADLEIILTEILNNNHIHHKLQSYVIEAFQKNIFIFNNFVHRNILKFPDNFKLERKVTDKYIQVDVNAMIKQLVERQRLVIQLKKELVGIEQELRYQTNKNNGYKSLLANKQIFNDLCTEANDIKRFLKDTSELFERYKTSCNKKDTEFDKLMEYKNIKSEFYRNERDRLMRTADFDVLENFNNNLK